MIPENKKDCPNRPRNTPQPLRFGETEEILISGGRTI